MKRVKRYISSAASLAVVLAAAPAVTSAAGLQDLDPRTPLELADAEQVLEQLRSYVWAARDMPAPLDKDFRGMKFGDDVSAVILTDAARVRLDAAMTAARTQTDPAAVRKALDETRDRLVNQRDRWMVLLVYWAMQTAVARHATLLAPALAETGTEAEITRGTLAKAHKDIFDARSRILAGPEVGTLQQSAMINQLPMNEILKGLNDRRQAWVDSHPPMPGTIGSLVHATPCGAPIPPNPNKREPSLGAVTSAPDNFYSRESKDLNMEGNVIVLAHVAASGCLESVEVQASSGVPDLDSSALRYADSLQYVPGYDGAKAVAGSFPFRVRFRLQQQ